MALVVETGTGEINSNSYISLTDANTYVADHGADAGWTAATDAQKESALRLATQYIDLKYGDRFGGSKRNNTSEKRQSLQWPRYNAYDLDGYVYLESEIPANLKCAVVESAIRIIAGDSLLGVLESSDIASESSTVGPLSESITYLGGKSPVKQYPIIDSLIRSILNNSQSTLMRG